MKRFSEEDKAKALQMVADGSTHAEAAAAIGCSTFAIQAWKKEQKANGKPKTAKKATKKATKKAVKVKCVEECACNGVATDNGSPAPASAYTDFVRKFWNKNYRAVNMVLSPKACMPPEEVVALVNEALQYAYDQFNK